MGLFLRNVPVYGLSPFKQNLREGLETFTVCYNRAFKSLTSQPHSSGLKSFSETLAFTAEDNIEALSELGFGLTGKRKLFFDSEYYNESNKGEIISAIKTTASIFHEMYELASDILEIPMSSHMNFHGFDYYYNYRITNKLNDTFKIIESGLLLDKAL